MGQIPNISDQNWPISVGTTEIEGIRQKRAGREQLGLFFSQTLKIPPLLWHFSTKIEDNWVVLQKSPSLGLQIVIDWQKRRKMRIEAKEEEEERGVLIADR